jgi:hypothetical protein
MPGVFIAHVWMDARVWLRLVVSCSGLSVGERVLKADYHGALLTVIRARSPTHVGQRGIIIQETQETFVVVTNTNAVKGQEKKQVWSKRSVVCSAIADILSGFCCLCVQCCRNNTPSSPSVCHTRRRARCWKAARLLLLLLLRLPFRRRKSSSSSVTIYASAATSAARESSKPRRPFSSSGGARQFSTNTDCNGDF